MSIKATIVADSVSESGARITTFSLEYGLLIHAEFLRHREQSHSVKSNRAIPTKVIRGEVLNDPYIPVYFGKNKAGMVAGGKCGAWAKALWLAARYPACAIHWLIEKLGGHKEWANRLLFPWQYVRETVTATQFDNFFNLRIHPDAQPDIKAIAEAMYKAYSESEPELLLAGEWFVPYVQTQRINGKRTYWVEGLKVDAETAIKCSAARVARSSYNNHDKTDCTLQADLTLYKQLIESKPTHASPVEAQATAIIQNGDKYGVYPDSANQPFKPETWEKGISHVRKDGTLCSGNLAGWKQARQMLEDHTCYNYPA